MKRKLTTGKPAFNPIPVKALLSTVGIDFVGHISPTADDGSCYILVEAIPTADKSTVTVSGALYQVVVNV